MDTYAMLSKKCLASQSTVAQPTQGMERITLSYIKNISETSNTILQPYSITVAQKPMKDLQNILSKSKYKQVTT